MNDHSDAEYKLSIVLQQDPETLYRVLNALNFEDADENTQRYYKYQYAKIIYDMYIGEGSMGVPEETATLIKEISKHIEDGKSEMEEIEDIELAASHRIYATAHGLDSVCSILQEYTLEEQLDLRLEYEFIYSMHRSGSNLLNIDRLSLVMLFDQWLVNQLSL